MLAPPGLTRCSAGGATAAALDVQTEAVYTIGSFSFENGGRIDDMKVGYVTRGRLNKAKDNAILLLPSSSYDASKPFGGDMKKALGQVKAKVLLLSCLTDRTVPAYLTRELQQGLKDATHAEIPSIRGHMAGVTPAGTAEYDFVSEQVKAFLALLHK